MDVQWPPWYLFRLEHWFIRRLLRRIFPGSDKKGRILRKEYRAYPGSYTKLEFHNDHSRAIRSLFEEHIINNVAVINVAGGDALDDHLVEIDG